MMKINRSSLLELPGEKHLGIFYLTKTTGFAAGEIRRQVKKELNWPAMS